MTKNNLISAKSILSKLDKRNDIERIRTTLYAVFISIILSENIFKRNIDIKDFLYSINLEYKDYVYSSRTLLVGRIIRSIETAKPEELYLYLDSCKVLLFPNLNKDVNIPERDSGTVDDLLEQFRRR